MAKIKSGEFKSEALLYPILDKAVDLRKEYRLRNTKFDQKRIKSLEIDEYMAADWFVYKKQKGSAVVRREKKIDERLENLWWVLLYKMGYSELNSGRKFRIKMKRRNDQEGEKQIDVFASDDETVIIAECKSCERLKKRSLQKDIEEFGALKGDIAASVKAFYGKDYKPKILWFFVTENIIWSEEDIARANVHKIKRVTEIELPYYTQLADHLGKAARFQFLAEFLKDQPIPEMTDSKVPATRGKLGGKYFYSFVTTPRHLLKIAFVNHRTLDDPEGYPTYQRLIQKSRLKAIGKFIADGGFFPNNLLINFVKSPRFDILQKDMVTDVHFGNLYLPNTYKSAWVIDGQHRLYGYAGLSEEYLDQKIVVVAFEGISKEEEANMFVTINHEQKSVPKNLLDDLEGQLKWGSDNPGERIGALAARVIHRLNKEMSSPLYGRFSAEGIRGTARVCLTVPQVKVGLKRSGLLGQVALRTHYEPGALSGSTDNATLDRAIKVLNGYFRQFESVAMPRWESGRLGKICTNESIQALTLLLAELIKYIERGTEKRLRSYSEGHVLALVTEYLTPLLDFLSAGDPIAIDAMLSVQFGSGGPRELLLRFARVIRRSYPDFKPEGYENWEQAQSEELRRNADQQVQQINVLVLKHIFSVFRKKFGEQKNAYWEKGVPIADIKSKAYTKSLETDIDSRLPVETYLDFIQLKMIVEHKDRWPMFKDVFDISEDGEKGRAKNLQWMDRTNELRRISAHAAPDRSYKVEDFIFLDRITETLSKRIQEFDYDMVLSDE